MRGWRWSLPLFTKELLEQAARRRTYVIRVLYVALLCYLAMGALSTQLLVANALNALGQGVEVLASLVKWEFLGIYLFLPTMACGVFTSEKERNTLALLFLTRLGPWTLIFEKLLGQLFPMLMFLCSALPVMAFTYSMGGLTPFQMFCSAWFLTLYAVQVACVAVMCSALCHSTARAFLQTYLVLFLLGFAPSFFAFFMPRAVINVVAEAFLVWIVPEQNAPGSFWPYYNLTYQILPQAFSPASLFDAFVAPFTRMGGGWAMGTTPSAAWRPAILLGIPTLLSAVFCLLVARWALYRRAFGTASNPLLAFFRGLDKIFFWANRKVAFDVKLVREADTLPGSEPIAWREVSKRSLGQFRYLVRIMVPMMFPVIFVGMFIAVSSANDWRSSGPNQGLSPLVIFLWIVSLVLIAVTAANTIPLEKMRQTWDVLRSMPMPARDILQQKLRGVRRLQWVVSIPVFSAIFLQAWWRYQLLDSGLSNQASNPFYRDANFLWWEYLFGALLSVWVYAELVKWTALWCGLIARNSMRAILMTPPILAIISCAPAALCFAAIMSVLIGIEPIGFTDFIAAMSVQVGQMAPVVFVSFNEFGNLRQVSSIPLVPALINLVCQATLLCLLRGHILKRAEWYLGRINPRRSAGWFRTRVSDVVLDQGDASSTPAAVPVAGAAL